MGFSRREPAMRVPAVSFPGAGSRQTRGYPKTLS